MRNALLCAPLACALFALPLLVSAPARAGISACGNIDVEAHAMCDVRVEGCELSCTPLTVQAACAAQLEASCEGSCPRVPSLSCTGTCQGSCEADCMVKPAEFECSASCKADATAQCSAKCASNANSAQCKASCQATFAAECDASCSGKPASATCKAKCEGRCQGSCTAQTELQCQVKCQGDGYAQCTARVEGGCKGHCSDPRGALFCDGEYIDHQGTVDECIAALKAALPTVMVDASAQGESSCSGSSCMASGEAQASASCALSPRRDSGNGASFAFGLFAALAAIFIRRRKVG